MCKHPSFETLEDFLLGRLDTRQAKTVVCHLLGNCQRCRDVVAPLAKAMFRPGRYEHAGDVAEREQGYERAVTAALSNTLENHRRMVHERAEAEARVLQLLSGVVPQGAEFWTMALCEALLEKAFALRHQDPRAMLHLTTLATEAAQRLDPERYGLEPVMDLRARAWAELANAYRVSDQLRHAEAAIQRALELRPEGSGSSLARARIAELAASLFCDRRQFPEAFRLLDLAHDLFRRHGRVHDAGRALIKKGLHTGYTGDPEEAIRLLARGLGLIDRDRDPKLTFEVLHNLLLFRVELGEYRLARRQLWDMRPLYRHYGDRIALIKLRGVEGRIYVGLGKINYAEMAFRQVRDDFDKEGLFYDAALISFDLAAVWLMQGKKAEMHRLVTSMLETFRSRYIAREAIAALLMLRKAIQRDEATVDLFEFVASLFRNLRDEARPQPEPV
jgi:tetratricopeptide (TPR) repeat protein